MAENDGKKIMDLKCIPTKKQKGTHPCDSIQNVNGGLDFDMNWLEPGDGLMGDCYFMLGIFFELSSLKK